MKAMATGPSARPARGSFGVGVAPGAGVAGTSRLVRPTSRDPSVVVMPSLMTHTATLGRSAPIA